MKASKSKSLAATRERRLNAGAKMSQMLDAEEEEFYKTTYGGFVEEAEDNDYSTEGSESDEVDSDFSIDENDEVISEDEDEGPKKRKMVYKEPKKEPVKRKPTSEAAKKAPRPSTSTSTAFGSPTKFPERVITKKSFRESTRRNAEETEARVKQALEESEARKKNVKFNEIRQLTQAEMLREAKKTEVANLKSLERYRKMELEKSKKTKVVKTGIQGPVIRYQSVTMPLIEEIDSKKEEEEEKEKKEAETEEKKDKNKEAEADVEIAANDKAEETEESSQKKCSRTFISFTDEETFKLLFPEKSRPVVKPKKFCPITNLPGRYFDPVTQLPFSNSNTFKALREAYYKQLELLGDMKQPEVARWVNWRKRTCGLRIGQMQPRIIQIIK